MVSPTRRREAFEHIRRVWPECSERRCCELVGLSRNAIEAPQRVVDRDKPLVAVLQKISAKHPRLGYRMLHGRVKLMGFGVGRDQVHRLCRKHGLKVPQRVRRRRAIGVPANAVHVMRSEHRNHVWTWDFVSDQTMNDGRTFKILTVVDEYTRVPLLTCAARHINSAEVIRQVAGLFALHGTPRHIRSDNGPEFIAGCLRDYLASSGVGPLYIEPGSPWQNGIIESFNGRLKAECLELEAFHSMEEARMLITDYQRFYRDDRPHSSLNYQPPGAFAAACRLKEAEQKTNLVGRGDEGPLSSPEPSPLPGSPVGAGVISDQESVRVPSDTLIRVGS